MNGAIRHIVIVGGGSAGWLTAGLLAATHRHASQDEADALRITLIESPDVPTIGVGEGTWPSMRDTLRRIGVRETDVVRECDAVFKQGSKFARWVQDDDGDAYHHPFSLPQDFLDADLVSGWMAREGRAAYAALASVQPHLCEAGRAPKQFSTPEFAGVANYAYHLDAARLGAFLRSHCVETLGVRHVADHMVEVVCREDGDIAAVRTRAHGDITGDLFIDCTGLRALLIGQHFGVGMVDCREVLFNDRALAVQVPYADAATPIACHTISTAQRHGWTWDIGLSARRGVGYVYSSAHASDAEAEAVLRMHIERSGGPRAADVPSPLALKFEPGYRRVFWQRNCVAVGLSSGFIEPLEASSLVLVELAASMIADTLPASRAAMDIVARQFNDAFLYRWARVIDFLKLHYVLSRRADSDYWRDHARPDTVPARLAELLALWRHRSPSRHDLFRADEIFPSASYHYILYGMGVQPAQRIAPPTAPGRERAEAAFRQTAELVPRMLAALPGHREMIDHIRTRGLPRI